MALPRSEVPSLVAHLPGVVGAVRATRDKIADEARAIFARHDHPGGHSIDTEDREVDALVSLVGPAPLSVEFGHFTRPNKFGAKHYVQGIHALGGAVAAAEVL